MSTTDRVPGPQVSRAVPPIAALFSLTGGAHRESTPEPGQQTADRRRQEGDSDNGVTLLLVSCGQTEAGASGAGVMLTTRRPRLVPNST
jgi:hypothetical protein